MKLIWHPKTQKKFTLSEIMVDTFKKGFNQYFVLIIAVAVFELAMAIRGIVLFDLSEHISLMYFINYATLLILTLGVLVSLIFFNQHLFDRPNLMIWIRLI